MGKIKNLKDVVNNNLEFLKLFDNRVCIYEKIQGYKFSVEKRENKLYFYSKYDKNHINIIDRTLVTYLEYPIQFFNSIDINIFPENYRFNFEYFFNNSPGNIKYDKIPESRLVLTYINIKNSSNKTVKIINNTTSINEWAKKLKVFYISPLFDGNLTEKQIENLIEFIKGDYSPPATLSNFIFNTLLQIEDRLPALQTNYTSNVDSIIFSFQDKLYKLEDNITLQNIKKEQKKKDDFENDPYSIFILDVMNYIEKNGFSENLSSKNTNERYIEFICNIFLDYFEDKKNDIINIDFNHRNFLDSDEFSINKKYITNDKVKKLIKDKKLELIFKIILSSFRKKKKYENYIFSTNIILNFNLLIDKIWNLILDKPSEFLSFSDFIKK